MSMLCIIQARLGSSRLPGKVTEVVGPCTALAHTMLRAKAALPDATIVVASPHKDGREIEAAMAPGIAELFLWDGPEEDVLARFAGVAASHPEARTIVRLTADCPLVDPHGIRTVARIVASGTIDFAWAGVLVNGLDAEAFVPELLRDAARLARLPSDREHVTPWMRRTVRRHYRFPCHDHLPPYRWTLDTAEDLAWLRALAEVVDLTPPGPSPRELYRLLEEHPHLERLELEGVVT